jgi:hypothetical protein
MPVAAWLLRPGLRVPNTAPPATWLPEGLLRQR